MVRYGNQLLTHAEHTYSLTHMHTHTHTCAGGHSIPFTSNLSVALWLMFLSSTNMLFYPLSLTRIHRHTHNAHRHTFTQTYTPLTHTTHRHTCTFTHMHIHTYTCTTTQGSMWLAIGIYLSIIRYRHPLFFVEPVRKLFGNSNSVHTRTKTHARTHTRETRKRIHTYAQP